MPSNALIRHRQLSKQSFLSSSAPLLVYKIITVGLETGQPRTPSRWDTWTWCSNGRISHIQFSAKAMQISFGLRNLIATLTSRLGIKFEKESLASVLGPRMDSAAAHRRDGSYVGGPMRSGFNAEEFVELHDDNFAHHDWLNCRMTSCKKDTYWPPLGYKVCSKGERGEKHATPQGKFFDDVISCILESNVCTGPVWNFRHPEECTCFANAGDWIGTWLDFSALVFKMRNLDLDRENNIQEHGGRDQVLRLSVQTVSF